MARFAPKATATTIKASTSVMGACLYCCCGLETMDGQPGAVAAAGGVMAGGAEVWGSGLLFLGLHAAVLSQHEGGGFQTALGMVEDGGRIDAHATVLDLEVQVLGGGPARAPRESDDVSGLDLVAYLDQVLVLVGVERLKTESVADDDAVAVAREGG